MSLASSLSSVGSVEGCGACDEPATLPASKRRKLEDSQHEPLSPAAPDPHGRDEEGQDSVTAQVGFRTIPASVWVLKPLPLITLSLHCAAVVSAACTAAAFALVQIGVG